MECYNHTKENFCSQEMQELVVLRFGLYLKEGEQVTLARAAQLFRNVNSIHIEVFTYLREDGWSWKFRIHKLTVLLQEKILYESTEWYPTYPWALMRALEWLFENENFELVFRSNF